MIVWAVGFVAVICVIVAQAILPFAFDFVTTLMVYGLGVFVGNESGSKKK